MASSALDGLIETFQAAMFVLDTPGAMVRSALGGGDPMAAAVDQDARIYGRDLLRQWGMAGPEDTWSNFGAGLAVDVGTDPLNFAMMGLGSLSKARHLAKAGKANKAVEAANTAAKARYADDVARGFMPEDVVAKTLAVDEAGAPLRQYHGTPQAWEGPFDPAKMDPNALYGPGAYLTDDPAVASGYAKPRASTTQPAGFVKQHFVDVQNPFDMRRVVPDEQLPAIEKAMAAAGYPEPPQQFMSGIDELMGVPPGGTSVEPPSALYSGMTGDEMFYTLRDEWDIANGGGLLETGNLDAVTGQAAASRILQDAGYDSITHEGGQIVGNVAHDVTIALNPSQVYLPYVAPNPVLQPLPLPPRRRLPLVPALAGYSAAQTPGRY